MSGEIRAPQAGPDDARCAAEERWRAVFENPHIGVAVVGSDRRFVETNARFQGVFVSSAMHVAELLSRTSAGPGEQRQP